MFEEPGQDLAWPAEARGRCPAAGSASARSVAALVPIVAALIVSLLLCAQEAPAQGTGSLRVHVVLLAGNSVEKPGVDAVVWLPGVFQQEQPGRLAAEIAQREKRFEPHVEMVKVGTTVAFPNYDRIYHNIFSLSEAARFDLGLYRNGTTRAFRFARPGIVRIYCNIHPTMSAVLVVVDSDFFAQTTASGDAELKDVPAGTWLLKTWHEQGGENERRIVIQPGVLTDTRVELDVSRWTPQPHKNKFGKDYPPPDDDETRY
ncbi:MAG: methylamine utilization protein [Acidobacteriota bacterium]